MFEACNGCTDRRIEPNCHLTCEKYLLARARLDEAKERERKAKLVTVHKHAWWIKKKEI